MRLVGMGAAYVMTDLEEMASNALPIRIHVFQIHVATMEHAVRDLMKALIVRARKDIFRLFVQVRRI